MSRKVIIRSNPFAEEVVISPALQRLEASALSTLQVELERLLDKSKNNTLSDEECRKFCAYVKALNLLSQNQSDRELAKKIDALSNEELLRITKNALKQLGGGRLKLKSTADGDAKSKQNKSDEEKTE